MCDRQPTGSSQPGEPISTSRNDRDFPVEYDPGPLAAGWLLCERYRDGWPIMARPLCHPAEAVAYIDELLAAGPPYDYQDEHGYTSCSITVS